MNMITLFEAIAVRETSLDSFELRFKHCYFQMPCFGAKRHSNRSTRKGRIERRAGLKRGTSLSFCGTLNPSVSSIGRCYDPGR